MRSEENGSLMFQAALSLFPEIISNSVLDDLQLIQRFGIETSSQLSFGDLDFSFDSNDFFHSVSYVMSELGAKSVLSDSNGNEWVLSVAADKNGQFTLLVHGEKKARLPYFWPLSPDAVIRASEFDKEARSINLRGSALTHWKEKISVAPLGLDSLDAFRKDLSLTPKRFAESLAAKLRRDDCNITDLIPREAAYYEALVGSPSRVEDLSSYVLENKFFMAQLLEWECVPGLEFALLLSGHSQFILNIDLAGWGLEDFFSVLKFIKSKGDVFSKVGVIELGLANINKWPEIQPVLLDLFNELINDDPLDPRGRFALVSSLVVLVIGELSRTKIFKDKPPFWIRLAAIAHASHIERVYLATHTMPEDFQSWVFETRGMHFFMQSLLDMRLEPRWQPDFISPTQLKFELLGRAVNALNLRRESITLPELFDLSKVDAEGRVSLLKFPESFLPGPLEGGVASTLDMPQEILKGLEGQLKSDVVNIDSFNSLVNSSLIFNITADHARLAATALRKVKYQLEQTGSTNNFFALISGLATVAAVTRSEELAAEVRILSRVTRRRKDLAISAVEELRIALIAAAAISSIEGWSVFLGDWLTEVSYEVEAGEQSAYLLTSLKIILGLMPELSGTCSKAEASLYISSQ
jgi:hypothetical protein